jgi:outer membrane protein assembly factor BamE (lipoprotein component of BamABCDE complex)
MKNLIFIFLFATVSAQADTSPADQLKSDLNALMGKHFFDVYQIFGSPLTRPGGGNIEFNYTWENGQFTPNLVNSTSLCIVTVLVNKEDIVVSTGVTFKGDDSSCVQFVKQLRFAR